jgi:cytochrome c
MKHRELDAVLIAIVLLVLIAMINLTARAAEPDATAGKLVFGKRCSGCHALNSDKEGPRLRGVLGRKAGSVESFQYSEALRNSRIVWDEALLDKWLENTRAVVEDNDMEFRVADPEERRALVAFLKSVAK